ncbi:MAG TPA: hypothetical protein PKG54_15125 [Phycisphaerae bacterium]|nr:hypothetical protein [Phycisphaerae bacterium]HQE44391.1 hypothetical protein [Phycisphaerae bacterium]HXK87700.1 hypothetical protein [Phycisphaerae bacterium]
MMRRPFTMTAWGVLASALLIAPVTAAEIYYRETWDTYINSGDDVLDAVWATMELPGDPPPEIQRYSLLADGNAFSAPMALEYPGAGQHRGWVNNLADGIDNGTSTEMYVGATVSPTPDKPLELGMYLRIQGGVTPNERNLINTIIVLSLGDQNAQIPMDAYTELDQPIPVLAFGMINGWPQSSDPADVVKNVSPYFFNGKRWLRSPLGAVNGYNKLRMMIHADGTIQLKESDGTPTAPYEVHYTGPFDTLSLRTNSLAATKAAHRIDDIFVLGGEMVGGSPTGACCIKTGHGEGSCAPKVTQAQCEGPEGLGGTWLGEASSCGAENANCEFCGPSFADMDEDGDVDQADYGLFQACFTGLFPTEVLSPACKCLDRDPSPADGDVDETDMNKFLACYTGPAIPYGPNPPAECGP